MHEYLTANSSKEATVESWTINREIKKTENQSAGLTQKKSRLYGDLQTLKAEVQEAEAVKKCVEQVVQPEQIREKAQGKRRDMEL